MVAVSAFVHASHRFLNLDMTVPTPQQSARPNGHRDHDAGDANQYPAARHEAKVLTSPGRRAWLLARQQRVWSAWAEVGPLMPLDLNWEANTSGRSAISFASEWETPPTSSSRGSGPRKCARRRYGLAENSF